MESVPLLDCAGRRRSPATPSGFHQGRSPRNKGLRYPPDPPTVEEIITVMRTAGDDPDGLRLRGVIVLLWRAGLRISEALALAESDLDPARGAVLVRRGKGANGVRSGWTAGHGSTSSRGSPSVQACRSARCSACCGDRPAAGHARRPGSASSSATPQRRLACVGGSRRHQLRHSHAVEMSREGVPLLVIQRQLGHYADLGITSAYLRGIDSTEINHTVHERPAPMIPATNALRLTR
jgi:integrase